MSATLARFINLPLSLDGSAVHARLHAELRAAHPRLTEQQIDLIADVAVELQLTRVRFEQQPVSMAH